MTDVIDAGRIISAAQMHHHDRHSQLSAVTCTVDQPVQHSLSALIGSPDIVDYVKRSVYALILQSGMRKSLGKFADASGARIAGEDTFKSQPAQHCSGVNILHPLDGAVNYPDFSHTSHLSRPTGRYLFTRIIPLRNPKIKGKRFFLRFPHRNYSAASAADISEESAAILLSEVVERPNATISAVIFSLSERH